jgi:hypothetical protein
MTNQKNKRRHITWKHPSKNGFLEERFGGGLAKRDFLMDQEELENPEYFVGPPMSDCNPNNPLGAVMFFPYLLFGNNDRKNCLPSNAFHS